MTADYAVPGSDSAAAADLLAERVPDAGVNAIDMVVVFLAFVFSGEVFLALMGFGMAAAIFVDGTIVRLVLVPAVMRLLGARAWWIPSRLDRVLPRLDAAPTGR